MFVHTYVHICICAANKNISAEAKQSPKKECFLCGERVFASNNNKRQTETHGPQMFGYNYK